MSISLDLILILLLLIASFSQFNVVLLFFHYTNMNNNRFLKWSLRNAKFVLSPIDLTVLVLALVTLIWNSSVYSHQIEMGLIVLWGVSISISVYNNRRRSKNSIKPLVYTAKVNGIDF